MSDDVNTEEYIRNLEAGIEEKDSAIDRLLVALMRYGRHDMECPCSAGGTECNCGLDEAFEEGEKLSG